MYSLVHINESTLPEVHEEEVSTNCNVDMSGGLEGAEPIMDTTSRSDGLEITTGKLTFPNSLIDPSPVEPSE